MTSPYLVHPPLTTRERSMLFALRQARALIAASPIQLAAANHLREMDECIREAETAERMWRKPYPVTPVGNRFEPELARASAITLTEAPAEAPDASFI